MANYWSSVASALLGRAPPKVSPYKEQGASGTAIFGGYIETIEEDRRLVGRERYRTASDIIANVSIVAAGLRYFLNLVAAPAWSVEPAKDQGDESSDAAKQAADFLQSVIDDLATPWPRIVRRSGMYRFHGFGLQEWTAVRRDDGFVGLVDIESRPQHTIETWERDQNGAIVGVNQRNPQDGQLIWLPRSKLLYLVDDSLTDSPEGLGWFRHLVDPAERLRKYLKLEGQGYERDMRGIPIGRAPLEELKQQLTSGAIDQAEYERRLAGIRQFIRLQSRGKETALLTDSKTYEGTTADGTTISPAAKWSVDLLQGGAMGFADLAKAIERLTTDMARILGVEGLIMGSGSSSGNRSLAEDKSRNLYINVNATLEDLRAGFERDIRDPVWKLNGFPDDLKPSLKVEDASFKDAATVAAALRDMAAAGAVLAPDDPAIDDLRDLLGISRAPEPSPEMMGMLGHNGGPPLNDRATPTGADTESGA